MQDGLNESTSVGRFGRFREDAGNANLGLNTCSVHGAMLFSYGRSARPIGAPALGREFSVLQDEESWTGRSMITKSDDRTFRTDFRITLPGPLYSVAGTKWGFDWALTSSPTHIVPLPEGEEAHAWKTLTHLPRLFLARISAGSVLVVTSQPAASLEIITHEHWWFSFDHPNARIMLVPLLDEEDAPRSSEEAQIWLDLVERPPLHCVERFEISDDRVTVHSQFTDAIGNPSSVAPLPPISALLGEERGLQELPESTVLLKTVHGPYSVVKGNETSRSIRMDWSRARARATRPVSGSLSPLPTELAFAGDWTWDESSPMDRLMSMRIWAPRADLVSDAMWSEIKRRVPVPSADEFRKSLVRYTEPATDRTWAKDDGLFAHCGEVSYDADWYNGLTLSGLRRAGECADATLKADARKLAIELQAERQEMVAYYEIFNDWALGASWTDPRGELFNLDCAHNGVEGILAEAAFREWEGDTSGRDMALYLAARAAPIFVAADRWVEYLESVGGLKKPVEGEALGMNHFLEWGGGDKVTSSQYRSYVSAGDFPEFCALLRDYGPIEKLRRLADALRTDKRKLYKDWLVTSAGPKRAQELRAGADQANVMQGLREQCGVFYFVSPDTALRLWVLGEDPDDVEQMYEVPMPLAPQLLCRAGVKLSSASE